MRQLLRSAMTICILVPGLATLSHAGIVTFNFDADTTGTMTPFTDTDKGSGLSATFTSSPDAGGFTMNSIPGFFQSLTGNFLLDSAQESLTIVFSSPQASISLDFATFDSQALNLSASLGATPVGSTSATGTVPGGGFSLPEGVLNFSGGTFDTVVLSSSTPNFGVDNITVNDTAAAVPEPGSFVLCGGILAALSLARLRRRSS